MALIVLLLAGALLVGGKEADNAELSGLEPDVEAALAALPDDAEEEGDAAEELALSLDPADDLELAPALAHLPPWTHEHVLEALAGESALLWRIAWCETGRSGRFNPYAIGGQGERGILQLLPGGGLRIFYQWGGVDPTDPYENVWFFHEVARGRDRTVTIANQWPRTSRGCPGVPY